MRASNPIHVNNVKFGFQIENCEESKVFENNEKMNEYIKNENKIKETDSNEDS